MTGLTDIEELSLRCRSEQSKDYIQEATLCYRAGAYRAAVVGAWIAVVFDLIDKVRELSLSGDAVAKAKYEKFDLYVKQINEGNDQGVNSSLEFERSILDFCSEKLEFFDSQQLVDLKRLREDRHRCAHPSFQQVGIPYKVSPEQARLHIRNAISHVLSQPPVQGKAAIAEIRKVVSSDYFPLEVGSAVVQLKATGLVSARPTLINAAIDELIFGFAKKEDSLYMSKRASAALNAICEMYPEQYRSRIGVQLGKVIRDIDDDVFVVALYLAIRLRMAWDVLTPPARDKVINFVNVSKPSAIIGALVHMVEIPDLLGVVRGVISKLDSSQLSMISGHKILWPFIKVRAKELLSKVKGWGEANEVFEKAVFPVFGAFE